MSTSATKVLNSRARVLKAATALFAAKGFHETSTREVARKARVNEITIFRHFKNKQELYLQVLNSKLGLMVPESLLPLLQSSGNNEEVFLSLAEHLQQLLDPVFLRLVFYAALEKPELLKKCYSPRLMSFHEILGEYIRERIDGGVLRNLDPMLMGRALVGIIAYQQILSQLLGGGDSRGANSPNFARTYMDIWLRGALKPDSPARRHSPDESTQAPETAAWQARR
ncbi:MAG: TetR/AcrR family transcriptional regulator [Terriglobales bacterium]